jgi:hypothetical protein
VQARVFRASDEREGPRRDSGEYRSPRSNQTALARRIAGDSRTTLRGVHTDSSGLRQTQVQGRAACGTRSSTRPPEAASTLLVAGGTKIVFTTFTAAAGRDIYTVKADRSRVTPITSEA